MKKIIKSMFLVSIVLVLFLTSCKRGSETKLEEVAFENVPTSLYVEEKQEITYVAQEGVTITWASSNENVATVINGTITALSAGKTTISAVVKLNDEQKVYEFNLEVKPIWFSISYVDEGEIDGGKVIAYNINDLPLTLPTPTKEGFEFLGWSLTEGGSYISKLEVGTTGNITLYGNWKEVVKPLEIIYNLDGGYFNIDVSNSFMPGEECILPTPIKDGYSFLGWSLEKGSSSYITTLDNVSSNVAVFANWEKIINVYEVTYNLDGGSFESDVEDSFVEGEKFTLPIPVKEGYKFLGWSLIKDSDEYVLELKDIYNDITVYGNWEKNEIYSSIYYILNGGRLNEQAPEIYLEGAELVLPIPLYDGFDFLGWTYQENGTTYISKISSSQTGDLTLYANWKEITDFKITYLYDEGEAPSHPATTFEEMDAAFWPAFKAWCGDNDTLESFKAKVLAAWSGGKDGGYKLYLPAGAGIEDENYFVNDPETEKFWYDWFVAVDAQITDINASQSAWGSAYVGYLRLNALFTGNVSLWNDERRMAVYEKCLCVTPLVTEYSLGDDKVLVNLVIDDGRTFLGWYDENNNLVQKITPDMRGDLTLTAIWSASTPAESFDLNYVNRLDKFESYALTWTLLPVDTTNKKIIFESSNPSILEIDKYGVMYAHQTGTVTVTYNVLANPDLNGSFEVEVYVDPYIDANFETTSVVVVDESIKINATLEGTLGKVNWKSSNTNLATVDSTGKVTALKEGYVTITAYMEGNNDVSLDFGVTILSKEDALLYSIITNAHNPEVYYVHNLNVAYDYDTSVACSVSDLLFNWEYTVNDDYFITPNRSKMTSIEFITVHYSGMPLAHQDGEIIATALYNGFHGADWKGTSWHYSTGNDGIFYSMDETKVAWHAGDGTGTAFRWINTGVKATSNTKPVFTIVSNSNVPSGYSFEVNGVKTNIESPRKGPLTFYGPTWKIENGYIYMGNVWYSSSYDYVSSRGGNLNSIGIESACNYGSDLWLTYHYTAQLVARLLDKYNLETSRVQGHHTFSGKDCPQTLLEGEGELWYKFMEMVEAELALYQNMGDYTIECVSLNDDLLYDNGRIKSMPNYTETVEYKLIITNNKTNVKKELTFSSIIHGLYKVC